MAPIRKGDGTPLEIPGVSEVRSGDGRVFFEGDARPDSAEYHWPLDDGEGTTPREALQDGFDAEFVGSPSWVDGGWIGGYALDLDGDEDAVALPKDAFEDVVTQAEWGIAFSVESEFDDRIDYLSQQDETSYKLNIRSNVRASAGSVEFEWQVGSSSGSDRTEVYTDGGLVNDGEKHRVFIRCTDMESTADDFEIYVDDSAQSLSTHDNSDVENSGQEIRYDPYLGGWNRTGSLNNTLDAVVDNPTLYLNPSRETITEDYEWQPWS